MARSRRLGSHTYRKSAKRGRGFAEFKTFLGDVEGEEESVFENLDVPFLVFNLFYVRVVKSSMQVEA